MKYRQDFVTNSSSSSSVVLSLRTNSDIKVIQFQFDEPGYWAIPSLKVNDKNNVSDEFVDLTQYLVEISETDKSKNSISFRNDYQKEVISYASLYKYLLLNYFRQLFYENMLGKLDINLDDFLQMNLVGEIIINLDSFNEVYALNQNSKTMHNIKLILDNRNFKIETYDEFSKNNILREIFDLTGDEILSIEENHETFLETSYKEKKTVYLESLAVVNAKTNGFTSKKNIYAKLKYFKEQGYFTNEHEDILDKKSTSKEQLRILELNVDYSFPQSRTQSTYELLDGLKELYDSRFFTPLQNMIIKNLELYKRNGKDWKDNISFLDKAKKEYINNYFEKLNKTSEAKAKKINDNLVDRNEFSSEKLIYDFDLNNRFPEENKKVLKISLLHNKIATEISYKPKSAINRIYDYYLNDTGSYYLTEELCNAERYFDGFETVIVYPKKFDNYESVVNKANNFMKVCLLYTNKSILSSLLDRVPKKKDGTLAIKRKTPIAFLEICKENSFYQLTAINISDMEIELVIEALKPNKTNYIKLIDLEDSESIFQDLINKYKI